MARPDWCSSADTDREQGIATRLRMFESVSNAPVLVIGTHFATPSAGRVVKDGLVWRFDAEAQAAKATAAS
jgi:hypothetical protein